MILCSTSERRLALTKLRMPNCQRLPTGLNTLYPALHRLERRGWIKAKWGASENNRRPKYYELTKTGQRQLATEQDAWEKMTAAVAEVRRAV